MSIAGRGGAGIAGNGLFLRIAWVNLLLRSAVGNQSDGHRRNGLIAVGHFKGDSAIIAFLSHSNGKLVSHQAHVCDAVRILAFDHILTLCLCCAGKSDIGIHLEEITNFFRFSVRLVIRRSRIAACGVLRTVIDRDIARAHDFDRHVKL